MDCRRSARIHCLNQCSIVVNWIIQNDFQWIKIQQLPYRKMNFKMSSAKRQHFFLSRSHNADLIIYLFSFRIHLEYIPRNMHTVFALLCFVVVLHWLIFPYPWGLLHWHCGNLTIAPVPAKQPWWIWTNTSCEFIMNDRITTTKQST